MICLARVTWHIAAGQPRVPLSRWIDSGATSKDGMLLSSKLYTTAGLAPWPYSTPCFLWKFWFSGHRLFTSLKPSKYGAQLDAPSRRKHCYAYAKASISEKRERHVNIQNLIEIAFVSPANFLSKLPELSQYNPSSPVGLQALDSASSRILAV
jgi:hypothetical protein